MVHIQRMASGDSYETFIIRFVTIGAYATSKHHDAQTLQPSEAAGKKGAIMNTLDTIQQIANERLNLYRKAGNGGLTTKETRRVQEITGELAMLWDQYRREYAGDNRVRNSDNVRQDRVA